ncbi:MAG: hypothetical protein GY927_17165, partial [bacterium]|nr:hypothetical protein [bacterium]
MKLRGRFTFWFCLAALVPIAAAALVTRTIVTDALRDQAQSLEESNEKEMRRILSTWESGVAETLTGLATTDDPYVGGTLLQLQADGGELAVDSRQHLRDLGGPLMRQLSLDMLYLLDHRDRVLDAPHFNPSLGEELSGKRDLAQTSRGKPYYA